MASSGPTENIVFATYSQQACVQKQKAWKKFTQRFRSETKTTKVKTDCGVHQGCNVLRIKKKDKLIILQRFKETFTVYRKRDGAVAILQNVIFEQPNPPAMIDISNNDAVIAHDSITLTYAVALKDWTHDDAMKFYQGEVVLILADIRQSEYVGMTDQKQIGVFPADVVKKITTPRRFLRYGMIITMECPHVKDSVELYKASADLFTWKTKHGRIVPLQRYEKETGMQEECGKHESGCVNQPIDDFDGVYETLSLSQKDSAFYSRSVVHECVRGEDSDDVLDFLVEKGHLEVSRALYEDVADYLTEDKWDEFGILLKVPPNTRRQLEREFGDIRDRTTALLNVWHQIRGKKATILKLIEALQEVKLKEITSLWEYMRDTLQVEDHSNV